MEILWLQVKNKFLRKRTHFHANIQHKKNKKYKNASYNKFCWRWNICVESFSKAFDKRIHILDQHIGMYFLQVLQKCLCLHLQHLGIYCAFIQHSLVLDKVSIALCRDVYIWRLLNNKDYKNIERLIVIKCDYRSTCLWQMDDWFVSSTGYCVCTVLFSIII